MINSVSSVSSVKKKSYLLNEQGIKNITNTPSSAEITESNQKSEEKKERRRDIYAEFPIRALGYTNELGEAIRPISPLLANLSWLPAIGYISADIADKYNQDEYGNQDPSKGRASKQFITQLLASVFLPTAAVKVGQSVVNGGAAYGKTGLTLNNREKISNVVINSMKSGEHKNFLSEDGKVNKEAYKEALSGKFDEILKHRKTHKKLLRPLEMVLDFVTKPIVKKPTAQKVKDYAGVVVDRMIDERQQLLDGIVPEKLSKRAYNKFKKFSKDAPIEETQSVAFDIVRKMEKGRMFNNRILKSLGGLGALAVMAKPIDKFVEHFIIDKVVSPQIDNISEIYKKQKQARA